MILLFFISILINTYFEAAVQLFYHDVTEIRNDRFLKFEELAKLAIFIRVLQKDTGRRVSFIEGSFSLFLSFIYNGL